MRSSFGRSEGAGFFDSAVALLFSNRARETRAESVGRGTVRMRCLQNLIQEGNQ